MLGSWVGGGLGVWGFKVVGYRRCGVQGGIGLGFVGVCRCRGLRQVECRGLQFLQNCSQTYLTVLGFY